MSYTADEVTNLFISALKAVEEHPDLGPTWTLNHLADRAKAYPVDAYLYSPTPSLISRIEDYKEWYGSREGEDAGRLMEEIAYLAFSCLKGHNSLKSYQSFGPQLDLTISGSDFDWLLLMRHLHLSDIARTIIVEAKNWEGKVDDKTFSRLCGILQNIFTNTAELGVFVTRSGATGFSEETDTKRQRGLSDAQALQLIFHARTQKYVVVLTHIDIEKLVEPGALPRILEAKIRAVEEWTGLPTSFDEAWNQIDLPPHLMRHRH